MSSPKKFRILVVDDDADIAAMMKIGLERKDFQVEAITDPLKALEFYKQDDKFDLALIDVRMEPINGFELYRKLLQINPNLKVCFITAFEIYYDEFKRVFPKIKVECFVHKPVSMDKLVTVIRTELERVIEIPNVETDLKRQ